MATTSYDVARGLVQRVGGNPSNTGIVRAVAIWLAFESGTTITGNNPWNIKGTGDAGSHYFTRKDGTVIGPFKSYSSLNAGLDDTARLLTSNYPAVVAAIRKGYGIDFMHAIIDSQWTGSSHYAASASSMLAAVGSSFSNYNNALSFQTGSSDGTTSTADIIARYIAAKNVDPTKPITASDLVDYFRWLSTQPEAAKNDPVTLKALQDPTSALFKLYAQGYVGKTWNDFSAGHQHSTVGDVVDTAAQSAAALSSIAGTLGQVGAFLADPENWAYILAFGIGVPMTLYAFVKLSGGNVPKVPML